jgi:hypothetical protein
LAAAILVRRRESGISGAGRPRLNHGTFRPGKRNKEEILKQLDDSAPISAAMKGAYGTSYQGHDRLVSGRVRMVVA